MPPIVAVLPIYVMFQHLRLLDTQVALIATLYRHQPADRGLVDPGFLRRHPARSRGECRDRRRFEVPVFFTIALLWSAPVWSRPCCWC